jgi:hypothetical protein
MAFPIARSALLVFALAAPAIAPAQIPTLNAEAAAAHYRASRRAQRLVAAAQYADAEVVLQKLVRETPGDGRLWDLLARARDRRADARGAVDAYRHSADLGYDAGPWTAYRMAELFARLGVRDSAIVWLQRSLAARWDDRPAIAADTAFASLRADPAFERLAGTLPNVPRSRVDGWRSDIDFLVREARRMHAGPSRPAFSAAFASAAGALKARVPGLSDDQILMALRRVVVLLGDGHSVIYGPEAHSPLHLRGGVLPVEFHEFSDGLYIIDGTGLARQWIGRRVLRIGGVAADEAMHDLTPYANHDNAMGVIWLGEFYLLPSLDFLHDIGAVGAGRDVTLTLQMSDGTARPVTVSAVDAPPLFARKLHAMPGSSTVPVWLRRVDTNYWLDAMPEHQALYFQFNQVRDAAGGPTLAQFADTLRARLEGTGARSLIVDVRHNNGGNNSLVRPLMRQMVWWETADPAHRIFVITSRGTFSAAQNFINRVERATRAIFVGEPSSSSPNFTGEETHVVLPYSRVSASISTMYWQDSNPDDTRRWIYPDVPVGLTSADYFAGRDPALDAIFRLIDEQR